jgi:hypothetical protein
MKWGLLVVMGLLAVIVVSGCMRSQPGDPPCEDLNNNFICDYDDFKRYEEEWEAINEKCYWAEINTTILNAVHDNRAKQVTFTVDNQGPIPLNLSAVISTAKVPFEIQNESHYIESGRTAQFIVNDVDTYVYSVGIWSHDCEPPCYDCPFVDLFAYREIERK